ncbi:MAG: hypothetical protein LIO46_02855, partial [Clostridiales bacterium]|nr:hypothetical protein [Clostridiales bacterium]
MKTTHDSPYGYLNITVNGTPLQYVQSFSVKHCPDTVPVHAFGEESAVAYVSQGSHFALEIECLPCLDAAL